MSEEEKEEEGEDIKDLEFRLSNDLNQLQVSQFRCSSAKYIATIQVENYRFFSFLCCPRDCHPKSEFLIIVKEYLNMSH